MVFWDRDCLEDLSVEKGEGSLFGQRELRWQGTGNPYTVSSWFPKEQNRKERAQVWERDRHSSYNVVWFKISALSWEPPTGHMGSSHPILPTPLLFATSPLPFDPPLLTVSFAHTHFPLAPWTWPQTSDSRHIRPIYWVSYSHQWTFTFSALVLQTLTLTSNDVTCWPPNGREQNPSLASLKKGHYY